MVSVASSSSHLEVDDHAAHDEYAQRRTLQSAEAGGRRRDQTITEVVDQALELARRVKSRTTGHYLGDKAVVPPQHVFTGRGINVGEEAGRCPRCPPATLS